MKKNYFLSVLITGLSLLTVQRTNAQTTSNSLLFDGTSQIVTVPDNAAYHLGTNAFTVECWIKATTTQKNYPMAISKRLSTDATTGFGFGIDMTGKIWVQINGYNFIPGYGADLRDNTCHHIALTRTDGTSYDTLKYYLDGAYLGNLAIGGTVYTATDSGPLYIGGDLANPGNNMYKGNVSEVRLWNYARSTAQISANEGNEINGAAPGLVGYWRLNEGSGQTVADHSTLANAGNLGATSAVESADPAWNTSCPISYLTGISDHSIDDQIKMYPNPTNNILNITGISNKTSIKLYDVIGKLVMTTETDTNTSIDINPLQEGIYMVVTENSLGRSVNKVIVQK